MALNPKDKSMICRMAGNIAGNLITRSSSDTYNTEVAAEVAVDAAIAIVTRVDSLLPKAKKG